MTFRPEFSHLPDGAVRDIDGRLMRHLGEGHFTLAEEPLSKRFCNDEEEPLHRVVLAA